MSSPTSRSGGTRRVQAVPTGWVMIGLAVAYAALFAGMLLSGGAETDTDAPGTQLIAEYDASGATVHIAGYAGVVAAALLVFLGAGLRQMLRRNRPSWTADAAFGGAIAMALALVCSVTTSFAMYNAVDTGSAEVVQAINVLDHAIFVPAMLGLACTMIGTGLAALRSGALPTWLAIASVIIGGLAPLGPGGFVPYTLFPVWIVGVAVLATRRSSGEVATSEYTGFEQAPGLR